jgi:biotin transport system substrate-specific component
MDGMRSTQDTARAQGSLAVTADARQARAAAVRPVVVKTALVLTGVGILVASARISVPFYPVPMTLQTLAVLSVAGLLGPRLGVTAVTGYLALGLAGAPVFSNGLGGPLAMAGPTWGYLMGFVPAAYLMGLAASNGRAGSSARLGAVRNVALVASGALAAEASIYALGLSWLSVMIIKDAGTAIAVGLVPFLLGDLVKTCIAVMVVCGGKNLLDRWGYRPI